MQHRVIASVAMVMGFFAANMVAVEARADVQAQLVAELPRNEVYEGQIFHDGLLWEGISRQTDTEKHHVDVYDGVSLQKIATVNLAHTVFVIRPYSEHQVVVIGKSFTEQWETHYTIITRRGSTFSTELTTFPIEWMVDHYAGKPGAMYFTEPGTRGVYKLSGRRNLVALTKEVSGPGMMELDGSSLWVLERRSLYMGDEGIVKLDIASGRIDRTFGNEYRNGLSDIKILSGYPLLAVSETLADQVLLIDRATNKLVQEIPVAGGPRGLDQLGGCLLVTSEVTKQVTFIALWGGADRGVLDVWDATAAGDRLKAPRKIAVDPTNGRIFLRSTYGCPSCSVTQSSVFALQDPENATVRKCLANY
jgi:hypothetical protein